jgi:signal peptidase I
MSTKAWIVLLVSLVLFIALCAGFTYLFSRYFKAMSAEVSAGKEDEALLAEAEAQDQRHRRNKALRLTGRIAGDALLGVLVVAFSFSLYCRINGNEPMIGGKEVLLVASGSMSERNAANTYLDEQKLNNQFDAYDLIGIEAYSSQEQVALYDVVAYKTQTNVTVIHRIIEVDEVNGETVYVTRGDSNDASDNNGAIYNGYLHYSSIVGHYDGWRWPKIGLFILFLQNSEGWLTVVAILYCAGAFSYFNTRYKKTCAERLETLKKPTQETTKPE